MDNQPFPPASAQNPVPTPPPAAVTAAPTLVGGSMPAPRPIGSPIMPPSTGAFSIAGIPKDTIMLALVAVLGVGALIFAIIAAVTSNQASVATKTLKQQKAATAIAARTEQKKADDAAYTVANEAPYRAYTAPIKFGSFEIKFPKNWSSYAEEQDAGTQVMLRVNPDFVRRTNGTDELVGARIALIERPLSQYMSAFDGAIKQNKIKKTQTNVSGLTAYDLVGSFPDSKTARIVVVPVRDKIMVFTNENAQYATEFNEILAQARIIP